jgi:hypothetical protein
MGGGSRFPLAPTGSLSIFVCDQRKPDVCFCSRLPQKSVAEGRKYEVRSSPDSLFCSHTRQDVCLG